MLNVLITGSTGFIGNHLKNTFASEFNLILPSRDELNSDTLLNNINVVIHLAGIAHDTADTFDFSQYNTSNTILTNTLFDKFIKSNSAVFIFMSSILVLSSFSSVPLTEDMTPNPLSFYAKSKYESELYIYDYNLPHGKRFYILRTPLVYGGGNKGNLILLYDFIKKIPFWPLGNYFSFKSFCDIRNISFVIKKMIINQDIENGIYHIADNEAYNLNNLYLSISNKEGKIPRLLKFPKFLVELICLIGSVFNFSFNLYRLKKITSTLLVSNSKVKIAINSELPYGSIEDLMQSFNSK
jgi:nucleoside-diphosphate-sugar epimerase